MNNKDRYIYLPHPTPGFERKVIKPNSERMVDACAELNRLHRSIAELEGRLEALTESAVITDMENMEHEWQPIDTAPKDGRDLILLLTPSGFPQVAYSNTWWTAGFSIECKPTHWMPLPEPPSGKVEVSDE